MRARTSAPRKGNPAWPTLFGQSTIFDFAEFAPANEQAPRKCWCCAQSGLDVPAAGGNLADICLRCAGSSPSACERRHGGAR